MVEREKYKMNANFGDTRSDPITWARLDIGGAFIGNSAAWISTAWAPRSARSASWLFSMQIQSQTPAGTCSPAGSPNGFCKGTSRSASRMSMEPGSRPFVGFACRRRTSRLGGRRQTCVFPRRTAFRRITIEASLAAAPRLPTWKHGWSRWRAAVRRPSGWGDRDTGDRINDGRWAGASVRPGPTKLPYFWDGRH